MNIELQHIHKHFGPIHANNDISVRFHAGRIVGILGENGAGKSTLMKILSGFQPADSGSILIDERKVDYTGPQAAIAHGIGMLQQDPLDVGAFTVLENFMYGAPAGLIPPRKAAAAQLHSLTQRFGFTLDSEAPVEFLSIAQRQQLEIIRLLALGVKALILDEPTTGISAEQKEMLFQSLRDLAKSDGLIVLLVSHKLEDVIALCDEVIVLRAGQLVGTRQMPATTNELVAMMFGQELVPYQREPVTFEKRKPVLLLDEVHLRDKRLDMPRVSLKIHTGEIVGLAGLDGSGQKLIMRAAAGLMRTTSGKVWIEGADMTGQLYRQFMSKGVVFGAAGRLEEGLIAGMTLTEHMAMAMDSGSFVDWKAARKRMESQIQQYDVRGRPTDTIEQLSGGNQQRVLMTLLPDSPALMILEQPTRGLDVESARWIWQQLLERRKRGAAILFSSAELDELTAYSDRIIVCYAGHLYEVPDVNQTSIDELGHLIGGEFERSS